MRRQSPLGAIVAGVTLAALLAGCGGSYTKRDFIARADAICVTTLRKARSIAPPSFAKGQQLRALATYFAAEAPIVESEATQIRTLPRPTQKARDRAALARYLAALADEAGNFKKLAAAAARGDRTGVASAEAALQASPVTSLATSYGLSSCGTPGATVA